jgi:hypothetical protein
VNTIRTGESGANQGVEGVAEGRRIMVEEDVVKMVMRLSKGVK